MAKNEAPFAETRSEPKGTPSAAEQVAEAESVMRVVRNNRGVDEAQARSVIKQLEGRALGDDLETKDGTWTIDPSGTPVLHRKEEELPAGRREG